MLRGDEICIKIGATKSHVTEKETKAQTVDAMRIVSVM
jgi:hypothetical protein